MINLYASILDSFRTDTKYMPSGKVSAETSIDLDSHDLICFTNLPKLSERIISVQLPSNGAIKKICPLWD